MSKFVVVQPGVFESPISAQQFVVDTVGTVGSVDVVSSQSFTTTAAGASPDYLRYLYGKPVKTDRINEPTLFDFVLMPIDGSFVRLHRGNYITFLTRQFGPWFTGYITNEPELTSIGTDINQNPIWAYTYQATSDDYLLNLQPLGLMPPFINTTHGAILRTLASRLAPECLTPQVFLMGRLLLATLLTHLRSFSRL
jgi:hypothetical protein